MEEPLGTFSVDLDGRFSSIRTSETNLGNFVCDIMMAATNADVAILNSGTLRSDRIHSAGEFKMRDLMTVLPMLDPLLVIEITGKFSDFSFTEIIYCLGELQPNFQADLDFTFIVFVALCVFNTCQNKTNFPRFNSYMHIT